MFHRMSFDLDILQATRDGFLAGVRALIAEKASNLHRQEPDGLIPLHQAAFYGHVELTTRLLQSGARIDLRENGDEFTPRQCSVFHDEVPDHQSHQPR